MTEAMTMSRRQLVAGVTAGSLAVACEQDTGGATPARAPKRGAKPGEYHEAPMLAERVEAGDLPPVKERLPKEPYVVWPGSLLDEKFVKLEIGSYGGTLQLGRESPTGDPVIFVSNNEPPLWAPGGFGFDAGVEGNVFAGWETNGNHTQFTFFLRDGLRWSDGEPVTIEDVQFAFEDVLFNEQVTPVFPAYLRSGFRSDAAPAEFEVIDDLTFTLSFDKPYGTFPAHCAITQWRGYDDFVKPRHYLEQFHEKYADAADLADLLKDESLPEDEWFNLFNAKQFGGSLSPMATEVALGHPTLTPWILTSVDGGVFNYERNPYYFKVDAEGNQLPYMDGVRGQVVANYETLTSRALFGEFDYLGQRASLRTVPLMREKEQAGEVRLLIAAMHATPLTVFLNLTHPDDGWRDVVGDVKFRQALSLAMDRGEIIDNFYLGEFASVPNRSSPGEYDVDEANRLLDEVGLSVRDSEGLRLGPDGNRFIIPFEIADLSENHIPVGELIAEHWNNVGISTTVRQVDSTLREQRASGNELKATIVWTHDDFWHVPIADDYLPLDNWGPKWQEFYTTQGESGEEPPTAVRELFDLHGRLMASSLDDDEHNEVYREVLQNHIDNIWTFPVVQDEYRPTFFASRIKNVPTGIKSEVILLLVAFSMEQWYIDG